MPAEQFDLPLEPKLTEKEMLQLPQLLGANPQIDASISTLENGSYRLLVSGSGVGSVFIIDPFTLKTTLKEDECYDAYGASGDYADQTSTAMAAAEKFHAERKDMIRDALSELENPPLIDYSDEF